MIDIFYSNQLHYMGACDLSGMFAGSLRECSRFLFTLAYLSLLFLFAKRLRKKNLRLMAAALMPLIQTISVWAVSIRSEFFFSFLFALLLTALFRIPALLPLRAEGYLFFFSVLLFPARLFNSTSAILGHLWLFWVLFAACYLTARLSLETLRGNHFVCYFSYITLSLAAYLIYLAISFLTPFLQAGWDSRAKALIGTFLILTAGFLPAAAGIRILFRRDLLRLNQFGQKYGKIERYFFRFSLLILAVCTLIFLPFTILSSQNPLVLLFFPSLCTALLCLQIPFLLLLFRVSFYKDSAVLNQWKQEGLSSYYQDLQENLDMLQRIRHDIKNIFFTMGGFVDRSDDPEMKAFFWDKIYPCSQRAIRESELLSSVCRLPDETLRAFLYLKLSQAVQRNISLSLHVSIQPEHFQSGMDLIDLTRVLGILLDNAMEEAAGIPGGTMEVQINGRETQCSWLIKNSITEETRRSGIQAGKTSKGPGRGQGLLIVRQIIGQYSNVVLNSCIQDNRFIQSLNIETGRAAGSAGF